MRYQAGNKIYLVLPLPGGKTFAFIGFFFLLQIILVKLFDISKSVRLILILNSESRGNIMSVLFLLACLAERLQKICFILWDHPVSLLGCEQWELVMFIGLSAWDVSWMYDITYIYKYLMKYNWYKQFTLHNSCVDSENGVNNLWVCCEKYGWEVWWIYWVWISKNR